jgi:AbrB family transcriptional regulator (stage V sporulation protein T)
MNLQEGDELEIFIDKPNELVFKKFSPVKRIKEFACEYAEILNAVTDGAVFVCDKNAVVAAAGCAKDDYIDKPITSRIERMLRLRKSAVYSDADAVSVTGEPENNYKSQIIVPIFSNGDARGAVIAVSQKKKFEDVDLKIFEAAALFLARQT